MEDHDPAPHTKNRLDLKAAYGPRGFIIMIAVIAVLVAAILVAVLPQFYIKKITVTGCHEISSSDLVRHTGISTGEHLFQNIGGGLVQFFTMRYGNIEKELRREYPYISDITIQATFPSRVNITVDERKKIGYVQIPDGYAVIDMDGYVVEMSGEDAPVGIPLMMGIPVRSAVLGQKMDMIRSTELNTCVTVLGAILSADANSGVESGFSLMKYVKSIRTIEKGTTFLTILLPTDQQELLVRIGSLSNISDQMNWLRYAVSMNEFDGDADGVLDMSGDTLTYRPVK